MPTVSLRMTDEQLNELREWARVGNRSMQREIIWRLFSVEAIGAPKYAPASKEPREAVEIPADGSMSPPISADAQPHDIPARTMAPPPGSTASRSGIDQEWLARRAGKRK